jgi:arabinose-5-phosphate isomerase
VPVGQSFREAIRLLDREADAINDVRRQIAENFGRFEGTVKKIMSAPHVILTGVGKSGLIAQRGAALLASVGIPASFMHPVDAVHGDCGRMQDGDLLIALSHSGETGEVCHFVQHVLDRVEVVGITAAGNSTLASMSNICLTYPVTEDGGQHGFLPTVSCAAQSGYLDALAVYIATEREVDPKMFLRHHPGGSLGRNLATS